MRCCSSNWRLACRLAQAAVAESAGRALEGPAQHGPHCRRRRLAQADVIVQVPRQAPRVQQLVARGFTARRSLTMRAGRWTWRRAQQPMPVRNYDQRRGGTT